MAVIPDKLIIDITEFLKDQDLKISDWDKDSNTKYVSDEDRDLIQNFLYAIDLTVKY